MTAVRRLRIFRSPIEKQRWNADYYSRNLTVDCRHALSGTPGAFFNRLQYPLLVPTSGHVTDWRRVCEEQISTPDRTKTLPVIAAMHYGYTGDCPRAERIASSVLVIPCNYALKAADVERIAMCESRLGRSCAPRRNEASACFHECSVRLTPEMTRPCLIAPLLNKKNFLS